ncbi:hypothetical protein Glove_14g34 [Diversispora epigaea]|uniref:Protein kinase domain-containing protein n=1 Tax=Diversispora epigaea TaxID=1348612 RepID=A0A397JYC9_9GLOM|nr:hypothetical protein Glove_14g34 [Diversispora epigaea]
MENICYNEIGIIRDKEKFQWYLKSSEGGDHIEQNNLGSCYQHGIGTTKDEEKAFQWYLKSAEGGNHIGQDYLGTCYRDGIGTIKDEGKSFQWYLKSAEGGNHNGQNNLGNCYQGEIGTTKDEEKAFLWYLKSAEGGNHMGQNNLGYCYGKGIGTTKDEERAFLWYLKSAEGGNNKGQCNLGTCYKHGIGTTKDEEKAFQWYLKSAEGGNSTGQCNLGYCYGNGIETTKDEEKAFQWYLKSAEGGDHLGQNNLGSCYQHGIGTTKDEEKAFQWYLKSAEGGDHLGQYNLGSCYQHGIGTTKDEEKAFQWYLKSAEGGDHLGQNNLGYCYQHGIGTTKDEEKAFQWYLKSAEGGNNMGQCNLGSCYDNGIGTTKDEVKAFRWYLKSAEGGNHLGQNNLGSCYQHGIGTTKDEEKAFQWYLKSAEGGNHFGQNNLGSCYFNGIGTTKDEEKAFLWYLKSAAGGNNKGQCNLGTCYFNGIGTTKDEEKAFLWYLKSAEGGNNKGQCNLGTCYQHGIGTTKDEEKAFQWYSKSAEGGDNYGRNNLEFFYRNEIGISKIKKQQNKLKYRCYNCENLNIKNNTCSNCNFIEPPKWTSGNNEIDKIIQMTQSDDNVKEWEIWRWINYSKFKNIKYLAEGGFGTIWKAEWIDMPKELFEFYKTNQIALKKLKDSQEISSEFLKELIANFQCRDKYVLPILGITQDPMTKEYAMVLRYMKNGNLRDFLKQNKSLPWIERLWLLHSFIAGLKVIHTEGGFGTIWKAEWIDMPKELFEFYKTNQIALKKLKDSQEISSEFLKELIANFQCRDKYVLPILGITQDPMTKEYAMVLRYMKNGNLRDFLKQNKSLPWIERLWLLHSFIAGLKVIHSKGLIHRDLHPGNLMITEVYNNSKYKFIRLGDLGLCRLVNEISSSRAYGVLPYIAPEVLDKHQYTKASDIYSVGIIMWIISTGKIPFGDRRYGSELAVDIFNGLRPKINKDTPQCYVELMEKCWHKDPTKRPNVEMIFDTLEEWIGELMYNDKTEHSFMFLNADQKIQDEELSSAETTHSEAHLTSKPLPLLPSLRYSKFENFNISNFSNFNINNSNMDCH